MTLQDQSVCIVGGTAGIGLAIAHEAARQGAVVTITGRDPTKAASIAASVGPQVASNAFDVTDPAAVAAFFAGLGRVDHLVITAAQVRGGSFRDGSIEDARASFEGKFWAQYLCVRAADVRRSIMLTSGTLSRKAFPGTAALAAVNGAVEALGRALAIELAPVRVNVLSPGLVRDTEAYVAMPAAAREGMFAAASGRLPAGLVGGPGSIAGPAVALLASDYVTGVVLDIDGGGLIA